MYNETAEQVPTTRKIFYFLQLRSDLLKKFFEKWILSEEICEAATTLGDLNVISHPKQILDLRKKIDGEWLIISKWS